MMLSDAIDLSDPVGLSRPVCERGDEQRGEGPEMEMAKRCGERLWLG